ncbi:MAG: response regulator [Candidatus Cloacimonadales bacterium]|nr:response regulator [Candidatus Cloacimonadales bacterium]
MARILITEDERLIAEDLKQTLQAFGHEIVAIVSTGEKAVEKAKELNPDIIFMDIKLEGELSGIEAAKEIRGAIKTAIIFCTAYSDDLTLLQLSTLSPEGYIAKPFRESEILNSIKHIANSRKKKITQNYFTHECKSFKLALNTI